MLTIYYSSPLFWLCVDESSSKYNLLMGFRFQKFNILQLEDQELCLFLNIQEQNVKCVDLILYSSPRPFFSLPITHCWKWCLIGWLSPRWWKISTEPMSLLYLLLSLVSSLISHDDPIQFKGYLQGPSKADKPWNIHQ